METIPTLKRCSVVLQRIDLTPYMNEEIAPESQQRRADESMDVAFAEVCLDTQSS